MWFPDFLHLLSFYLSVNWLLLHQACRECPLSPACLSRSLSSFNPTFSLSLLPLSPLGSLQQISSLCHLYGQLLLSAIEWPDQRLAFHPCIQLELEYWQTVLPARLCKMRNSQCSGIETVYPLQLSTRLWSLSKHFILVKKM